MTMSKKKKSRFVVWTPVKGYTKCYLVQNFNSPDQDWPEIINLSADPVLKEQFTLRLKRCNGRRDKQRSSTRYTAMVPIEISADDFRRYGWSLTETETVKFNNFLENRIKTILHTYVSMLRVTGMPISECIKRFRERTKITEFDWDTDSIRKELYRKLQDLGSSEMNTFLDKIEQKVWALLSKNKTITEKGKENYENNHTEL